MTAAAQAESHLRVLWFKDIGVVMMDGGDGGGDCDGVMVAMVAMVAMVVMVVMLGVVVCSTQARRS